MGDWLRLHSVLADERCSRRDDLAGQNGVTCDRPWHGTGALDPATTYDADGWSIIHSIYDSLVQFGPEGEPEPLLAESFTLEDPLTLSMPTESLLATGRCAGLPVFHRAHHGRSDWLAVRAGNFAVISRGREVEMTTVDLKLSAPAPWLPEQTRPGWRFCPDYAAGNDFIANPAGTGPHRFEASSPGDRITVLANEDYFAGSPKGQPVAGKSTTVRCRRDDLGLRSPVGNRACRAGCRSIRSARSSSNGDSVLQVPIAGCAFIRIPTDVEPFSDVRARRRWTMRSRCAVDHRGAWRASASACRISSYRMDLDTTRNSRPILTTGESARAAGRGWVSGWVRHFLDVTVTNGSMSSRPLPAS